MTRPEFESRLRAAQTRLAVEWEAAWRDKSHGDVYVGAYFAGGVPGDLIVTSEKRYRERAGEHPR